MNHKEHSPILSHFARDNGGYVLFVAVFLVTAIISVVAIKTALSSLTFLQTGDVAITKISSSSSAESCMNEALLRLNWDNTYEGEVLAMGDIQCNIIVTGIDSTRTIVVTAILNNNTYSLTANVQLSPFSIVSWDNE